MLRLRLSVPSAFAASSRYVAKLIPERNVRRMAVQDSCLFPGRSSNGVLVLIFLGVRNETNAMEVYACPQERVAVANENIVCLEGRHRGASTVGYLPAAAEESLWCSHGGGYLCVLTQLAVESTFYGKVDDFLCESKRMMGAMVC